MASASEPAGGGGGSERPANRLAREQSPYLLQHAHNPVDWYPWGEEAFEVARERDVPIFLSVGYSTCHWCHVMERESFEDPEAAALLNGGFVAVKVDREERPDVDSVYMTYVQALTGGGGWPMSVWLTPQLQPIYGATYLPPKDMPGMPSFSTVLRRISQAWSTQREALVSQAASTLDQLRAFAEAGARQPEAAAGLQLADAPLAAARELMDRFDAERGGFGGAPKFPRPSELNALLAASAQAQLSGDAAESPRLLSAALATLRAYCRGGMYDHLGGGFHRYSVDEYLHVPHLVSTLLDALNAAAAAAAAPQPAPAGPSPAAAAAPAGAEGGAGAAAAEAAAAGGGAAAAPAAAAAAFGDVAGWALLAVRGTLDYLLRDMAHPRGGFYSAEDADSLDPASGEKTEGAFYAWTYKEVAGALAAKGLEPALFCEVYDVRREGNCDRSPRSDPHGEFSGKNVLIQVKAPWEAAAAAGLPPAAAAAALARARAALHAARAARPRPSRDEKVVAAWNGQAIGALARAARALPFHEPGPAAGGHVAAAAAAAAAAASGGAAGGGAFAAARGWPAEAGRGAGEYLAAAAAAAAFARAELWDAGEGKLRRSFCGAPGRVWGFAADYAYTVAGLIALAEAGGGAEWLGWAGELQDRMDELFWDEAHGGWFDSAAGADPRITIRTKEDYDGAEPAPSSIAAANLVRLAALLPGPPPEGAEIGAEATEGGADAARRLARADAALAAAAPRLSGRAAVAAPQACAAAWLRARAPLRQAIVAGRLGGDDTAALLAAAHGAWPRDLAVICIDPSDPADRAFWRAHNPRALEMVDAHARAQSRARGGGSGAGAATAEGGAAEGLARATAFVCANYTCRKPTEDPAELSRQLRAGGAAAAAAAAGAPRAAPFEWPQRPAGRGA
ncbi:hypothetical protein Rsub_10559 [Raphidocelis subcapitata]|uniref:Spermatogenesis-associated protein 20-like TRX domain-containing protein n=1 Tax=Raphidocelis subcapitata TaxID=307507 RepID=A0A2V0PLD4_9CHLO|nr:hypothetical protein Rsub_10559 [Raphidocelis subcapitata]|eukprot:GBF98147.1 hypothetical protein Rsub_10559 [Raphidocelis subcapitata]